MNRDRHSVERGLLATDLHIETTYRLTEELVAAECRMRRRVDLLEEIVFETDDEGRLVFLNRAWQEKTGHTLTKCMGRQLSEFIFQADQALLGQIMQASGAHAKIRLHRLGGTLCWMEISVRQFPGGVVGAMHDITSKKIAEDQLAMLSLVASFTENLVIITDQLGLTEWVNQAFTKRTGYRLGEISGKKPGKLLQGPDTDATTIRQISEALREGRSIETELINYTRAGDPYWVWIQITPIRGPGGEVERFIAIQTDSSELHRTRQELKDAKERAEAANEAKTQFLATVSHEMRTPLNAVIGSTELGLDTENLPSLLRRHLETIGNQAEILLRFINDILDVSKIEAGRIDFERIPLNLRTCIPPGLETIGKKARAKRLEFDLHFDEALPEHILGDPDRLRQIVINLADNAVKFTEQGSIGIEFLSSDSHLEIRVRDTGIGIDPEAQFRIFQRFEQADNSTTRRKGGAGLGLSIVKSIVEVLGGELSLHSLPGQGSDFKVRLPLEAANGCLQGGYPAIPSNSRHLTIMEGSAFTILIAEDNDTNFEIVEMMLAKTGIQINRANTGKEAIALSTSADMILMDVEMPEMDGLEATRRIREAERSQCRVPIPIVALTAHASYGYQERCLTAGCTGYLTKPIRRNDLISSIASSLQASCEEPATGPTDGHG